MRRNLIKTMVVGIIIWAVSASYGHYVTKASVGIDIFNDFNVGTFSSIVEKIFPGSLGIKAKAVIVVDAETGEKIYSKNENYQMPIASLTKLATTLVFMESGTPLTNVITMTENDFPNVGGSKLYEGESITVNQCLHLCLICSDNAAANALSRSAGYKKSEFVGKMNQLAMRLGLDNTRFTEPTGLDSYNMSTPKDYIVMMQTAFAEPTIRKISSKKTYQFSSLNRGIKHSLFNTNRLLYTKWDVVGGKTGYISKSGYCLALDAYDETGRRINAIILGAPSNQYRYRDANRLLAFAGRN